MNCAECNKSKADLQTGDCYCKEKDCLVGQQEECQEESNHNEDTGLTMEKIWELIDRDTAKEPIKNDLYYFCPNCKTRRSIRQKHDFCHDCGQKLKWED